MNTCTCHTFDRGVCVSVCICSHFLKYLNPKYQRIPKFSVPTSYVQRPWEQCALILVIYGRRLGGVLSHVPEVTQPRDLDVMSPEVDDLVLWISVNSLVSGLGWCPDGQRRLCTAIRRDVNCNIHESRAPNSAALTSS